jgi:RimJ/RimL family protein N-acetyltransferase
MGMAEREYYTSTSMENRRIIMKGENVGLAEMLAEDQPFFQKWLSENEELRRIIENPEIPDEESQRKWFQRNLEPDRKMFSIIVLDDERLIGHCGFVEIDDTAQTGQLRITLGDTNVHGKGYGTEATQLLLRYAFDTMGLASVWLRVRDDNPRAIRVYEKTGFTPAGTDDDRPEILRMRITREDFHSHS